MLDDLHTHLVWLRAAVLDAIRGGNDRAAIQAANLIPPGLDLSGSNVQLAYLVLRENVINRLFDQNTGYWQNGLHGLDALSDADRGQVLVNYLGVSEAQIAAAIEQMIADGKHELAAETLRWVQPRFPGSARLRAQRDLVYVKLMEKYQDFSPFKFIVYAGQIDASLARSDVSPELPVSAAAR